MKLKTAVISVAVSLSLVAGAGYAAYYTMQGKKSPVEVVPVSNVNTGFWGQNESIFGTVTSQVAQTVSLNEEYTIDKIFVSAGDEVKEGDPLFSYDMTLQELELEMEQLSLQTQELTMTKLEKDLEKLKKTTATASLEPNDLTMTAASAEETIIDEPDDGSGASGTGTGGVSGAGGAGTGTDGASGTTGAGGAGGAETGTDGASGTTGADGAGDAAGAGNSGAGGAEGTGNAGSETDGASGENGDTNLDGFQIEGVQELAQAADTSEETAIVDSVLSYERLVLAIDALIGAYGDSLHADEIGGAVEEAVLYYRRNLADEQITDDQRTYQLKATVTAALGEEETEKLQTISRKLDEYQVQYVDLLIRESAQKVQAGTSGLSEVLADIQESYGLLDSNQQKSVQNMTLWQELQAQAGGADGETSGNAEGETTGNTDGETTGNTDGETTGNTDGETSGNTEGETSGSAEGETETVVDESVLSGAYAAEAPENQTSAETERKEYTLTIIDAAQNPETVSKTYAEGDTVLLEAKEDPTRTFERWEAQAEQWETADAAGFTAWKESVGWENMSLDFAMPAYDVTVRAVYVDNMAQISEYINTFVAMAETALADGAKEAFEEQGKSYATELESAVAFYQQWLAELPAEILSTAYAQADMDQYQLRQNVVQYLTDGGQEFLVQQLQDSYRQLCIRYMRALFDGLDPKALVRADLEKATEVYALLGDAWRAELEQQWQEEQSGGLTDDAGADAGHTGEGAEGESEGIEETPAASAASIGDLLAVYRVYLLFQEFQQMDPSATEEERFAALQQVQQAYLSLTEEQKLLAAQNAELVNVLSAYGLWEDPNIEPETGFGDLGGGDFGDFGDVGYTAAELKELIADKERDIKTCALDMREIELTLKQKQRIVDGKIVKSTLDGTVVSIGTEDGESEDDYFAKVTNQTGLYAKGSMNELALQKIHVGDTISGMLTSTGVSFTAVIKEISQYPDPNGGSTSFGAENTNASYYPFYAQIENTEGVEEGEAEIQFSDTLMTSGDSIYLEKYFVRTESDGRAYVYMQGENKKLKKQYVKTGKSAGSWATEIVSGLEQTDKIAFPYGKNVQEGAETKEVDALTDAYM